MGSDDYNPNTDQELASALGEFDAAKDQDASNAAKAALTAAAPANTTPQNGLQHWFVNLPQNVTSGVLDAAINAADAGHSAWKWVNDGQKDAAAKVGVTSMDQQRNEIPTPEYDSFRGAVQDFKSKYIDVPNPTTADNVTQGLAQFIVPMLGYSKAISTVGGAGKLWTAGRAVVAESATAATAMAPHDGRFADMVALGKHAEGKLGDVMNAITPDGSLLNHYIDYMTDRTDESEAEGRVKNIVDNVTGSTLL